MATFLRQLRLTESAWFLSATRKERPLRYTLHPSPIFGGFFMGSTRPSRMNEAQITFGTALPCRRPVCPDSPVECCSVCLLSRLSCWRFASDIFPSRTRHCLYNILVPFLGIRSETVRPGRAATSFHERWLNADEKYFPYRRDPKPVAQGGRFRCGHIRKRALKGVYIVPGKAFRRGIKHGKTLSKNHT